MKVRLRWSFIGLFAALILVVLLLGLIPVPPESPALITLSSPQPLSFCPLKTATAPVSSSQILTVRAGEHIQEAVNRAHPGDTIQIMPGTYTEEVTININNLTLEGVTQNGQRPILDGQGKLENGVVACSDQSDIENLEIRNYTDNGVVAANVNGVVFRNLLTDHTGDYGLFPVRSNNITIENCVATGASDTGIYVGESTNIILNNSEAYGNVSGIEVENSSDAVVTNN